MKKVYVYPAKFYYDDDGISVEFPDLPGALTCADTTEEALVMARECLSLHLYGMEEDNDSIPEPTEPHKILTEPNEVIVLVDVFMTSFRSEMRNKAVKKTLTIPQWLNDLAEKNNVEYSKLLQNAIKDHLGIKE